MKFTFPRPRFRLRFRRSALETRSNQAQFAGRQPERGYRIQALLLQNFRELISSLGKFAHAPLGHVLSSAVIGISLALPASFYLLLENARHITMDWETSTQLMVFLDVELDLEQAEALRERLLQEPGVAEIDLVSKEQAMAEYQEQSGFADVLVALDENPLPHVLMLSPERGLVEAGDGMALGKRIGDFPGVDIVLQDQQWVSRLLALIDIFERGTVILSLLLAMAVLLVIGNTIRLSINTHRQEIEIAKLFGASDDFICRPFLYDGFWHGVFGAILAWLMLVFSLLLLREPMNSLIWLYGGQFQPVTPGIGFLCVLLCIAVSLGLLGSWFSVHRHIRDIEPA